MTVKVFISHKNLDRDIALKVQRVLKSKQVEAYLDLLDESITGKGEVLTKHIKQKLNECTDILVVMSENTKGSWWVPFEIGMAAQRDLPTVSYLQAGVILPDYLSYWPRLKNDLDLEKYVDTRIKIKRQILNEQLHRGTVFASAVSETERFYNELKAQLR